MSISSSEPDQREWRRFIGMLLGLTAAAITLAFLFVAIVDPYNSLAFSPPWKRYRVTTNERYAFPGLIRHGRFDSAAFGTSTTMLLKPADLSDKLGGRFANLSMAAGTPWEQSQLMKFFITHSSASIRTVIIGIDQVWCSPSEPYPRLTQHPFPPWEFDDDPFNDYAHLLNSRALAHAAVQLLTMTGILPPRFRSDGYFQFAPDDSLYDFDRVQKLLYKSPTSPRASEMSLPPLEPRPANWDYPDLQMLSEVLDRFAAQTRKIIMFVPFHFSAFGSPERWTKLSYCKLAVVDLAKTHPGVTVIDFMRPSVLTRNDTAYWDDVHYRIGHAVEIIDALRDAVVNNNDNGALYKILWRPGRERSNP